MACVRCTVQTTGRAMRTAVLLILSLVAASHAEAPYHLPRPGPNAPSINYQARNQPQSFPLPLPAPQQSYQYQYNQVPQQNYIQGSAGGYRYQQPNIGPTYVQPQPLPAYIQPQFQVNNQQQFVQQPNSVYGSPFLRQGPVALVPQQPLPLAQQGGYIQQPAGIYQQGFSQGGYSSSGAQSIGQAPLTYNTQQSPYSSYQADSNAYLRNQVQRDALDSTVVDRIQNILTENEHTSARSAGYLSLVSGVSLEGVRPSLEISSFVQNTPLRLDNNQRQSTPSGPSLQELARGSAGRSIQTVSSGALSVSADRSPSGGYGLPTISANNAQSSQGQISNFLPQTQGTSSYGPPN